MAVVGQGEGVDDCVEADGEQGDGDEEGEDQDPWEQGAALEEEEVFEVGELGELGEEGKGDAD